MSREVITSTVTLHNVTVMLAISTFVRIGLQGRSEQTKQWYQTRLLLLAQYLGETRYLFEVLEVDLIAWRESIEEKDLSPHTIHGYIRAVRRLFRWLYKRGMMSADHQDGLTAPYNSAGAGALPNSHQVHVDEVGADNGYDYPCWYCHPSGVNSANYTTSHQSGSVNWSFANNALDPAAGGPRNETYNGAQTGSTSVKYGTGTFYSCGLVYCHGNFTAATLGGGNSANAPTWGTVATGDCGTCHGSTGVGTTNPEKASPITGAYTESHTNHVDSNSVPGCSACHDSDANGAVAGEGTYGDESVHANGSIQLVFGQAKTEAVT